MLSICNYESRKYNKDVFVLPSLKHVPISVKLAMCIPASRCIGLGDLYVQIIYIPGFKISYNSLLSTVKAPQPGLCCSKSVRVSIISLHAIYITTTEDVGSFSRGNRVFEHVAYLFVVQEMPSCASAASVERRKMELLYIGQQLCVACASD